MNSTSDQLSSILLAEHDSLRHLAAILKEEQQLILNRQTEPLMALLSKIEDQLLFVRQNQARRDQILQRLLPDFRSQKGSGLAARVALLPPELREQPLDIAQRIDTLLMLIHELSWQNHVLLSHSLHFLEQVLAPWLDPKKEVQSLYGQNGLVQKEGKRQALFQVVA